MKSRMELKSSHHATTSCTPRGTKLCDTVYSLHEPEGVLEAEIVFIHGLQLDKDEFENAYWKTWLARDGTGENCWPMTWLAGKFPNSRILSVSYDACAWVTSTTGRMDSYLLGESLVQEMSSGLVGIGQEGCPVVFVCHSLGGLIAKQIVVSGHRKFSTDKRVCNLLVNLKAFFFYATPHTGSKLADLAGWIPFLKTSPLVENLKVLNRDVGRLNNEFEQIREHLGNNAWEYYVVGEMHAISRGGFSALIVEEVSARYGNKFLPVGANHIDVCRPKSERDSAFQYLIGCLTKVVEDYGNKIGEVQELPSFVVGMKGNLEEARKRLKEHSVISLVGMGGIGKTTLSKQLFNEEKRHFERVCFLEDVKSRKCVEASQKRLFRDVCGTAWNDHENKSSHLKQIKDCIRAKKVLLVIDDVGAEKNMKELQVHAFMEAKNGSKVIVTSRQQDVLHVIDHLEGTVKVEVLKEDEAFKLFSWYAFHGVDESERIQLNAEAEAIIEACGKLPLSLEVTGQFLRKCNRYSVKDRKGIWKEALRRLQVAQAFDGSEDDERLWKSLKVSYDDLNNYEKSMFLDFACNLCECLDGDGNPYLRQETVARIWDSPIGVLNLINRSLIKCDGGKKFLTMHDQLRDMGRRIVCDEANGNMSRMWKKEEGLQLMQQKKSCTKLEALSLCFIEEWEGCRQGQIRSRKRQKGGNGKWLSRKRSTKGGNCLEKLRLLDLRGSDLQVVEHYVELCSKELTWLSLDRTGITSGSILNWGSLSRLYVLMMNDCFELEKLPTSMCNLCFLKELQLSGCILLKTLPDVIGNLKDLQVLNLEGCKNLTRLPDLFGNLQNMQNLDLCQSGIESLPESFGQLRKLELLELKYCRGLTRLPNSFGGLESMHKLKLGGSGIESLPESFGQLRKLEVLSLRHCGGLTRLPDSFGGLESIQNLKLWRSGIESLPESFGQLRKLEVLDLGGCVGLTRLPDSFGGLESMQNLELWWSGIESLPESFGRLRKLEVLDVSYCGGLTRLPDSFGGLESMQNLELWRSGIESLPESFGQLRKLEVLDLSGCVGLTRLPDSFGGLESMQNLELWWSGIESLPESFGRLRKLEVLDLSYCGGLTRLPDSFGGLESMQNLELWRSGIDSLPESFGQLRKLEVLDLSKCGGLTRLPDSFGGLESMQNLKLEWSGIESLPESFGQLRKLEVLDLSKCGGLTRLPDSFGGLESMHKLKLRGSGIESLPESFGQLRKLEVLDLSKCGGLTRLPDSFGGLESMQKLKLRGSGIESLPESFGQLRKLEVLDLRQCGGLTRLSDSFGGLQSMQRLRLWDSGIGSLHESFG